MVLNYGGMRVRKELHCSKVDLSVHYRDGWYMQCAHRRSLDAYWCHVMSRMSEG